MKYVIEIDDLDFNYKDKKIFNGLNLSIKEGSFTTIVGPNGSGKTTLIKLILGIIRGNSVIMCGGLPVTSDNLKVLRRDIGVLYERLDQNFVAETVMDDIAFNLENLNLSKEDIKKRITSISNKLKIKNLLEKEPHTISAEDKWLVSLASALTFSPKILIIDNGFNTLSFSKKEMVLSILSDLKEEGMSIINVTSDVEECLYGDEIILLNNGKALLSGHKEEVLDNSKFEDVMHELPFIISLSDKLKFYNLIDKSYYDMETLVNDLWK